MAKQRKANKFWSTAYSLLGSLWLVGCANATIEIDQFTSHYHHPINSP